MYLTQSPKKKRWLDSSDQGRNQHLNLSKQLPAKPGKTLTLLRLPVLSFYLVFLVQSLCFMKQYVFHPFYGKFHILLKTLNVQ